MMRSLKDIKKQSKKILFSNPLLKLANYRNIKEKEELICGSIKKVSIKLRGVHSALS